MRLGAEEKVREKGEAAAEALGWREQLEASRKRMAAEMRLERRQVRSPPSSP